MTGTARTAARHASAAVSACSPVAVNLERLMAQWIEIQRTEPRKVPFDRSCLGALFVLDPRSDTQALRTLLAHGAARSQAATTALLEHPDAPEDVLDEAVSRCTEPELLATALRTDLPTARRAHIREHLDLTYQWDYVRLSEHSTPEEIRALWDVTDRGIAWATRAAQIVLAHPATPRDLALAAAVQLVDLDQHSTGASGQTLTPATLVRVADAVIRHDLNWRTIIWRAPRRTRPALRRLRTMTRHGARIDKLEALTSSPTSQRGVPHVILELLREANARQCADLLSTVRDPALGAELANYHCEPTAASQVLSSSSSKHLAQVRIQVAIGSAAPTGLFTADALSGLEPHVTYEVATRATDPATLAAALTNPHLTSQQLQSLWDQHTASAPIGPICDLFTIHPNSSSALRHAAAHTTPAPTPDYWDHVSEPFVRAFARRLVADGAYAAARSLPVRMLRGSPTYWPLLAHYAALAVSSHPTPPSDLAYLVGALTLEATFKADGTLGDLLDAASAVSA